MHWPFVRRALLATMCAFVLMISLHAAGPDKKNKPSIVVKVTPLVGFSPARMVVTADLKGGADDYEAFYCPTIEWDWGDDTRSEMKDDCEPYEAGKSEIKRHFSTDHVYNTSGEYRAEFRIKQKDKVVARGSTDVKLRPGIRDGGMYDR